MMSPEIAGQSIDLQETFWKIRPTPLLVEGRRITEHYLTIYSLNDRPDRLRREAGT